MRLQRPKDELTKELLEQIQLLQHACRAFDDGLEAVGKHIALTLRLLLHEHRQSRALLHQLGIRDRVAFRDTAGPLNPQNLLSECNLVALQMNMSGGRYIPVGSALPRPVRRLPFNKWWNTDVLKDNRGRKLSRGELIRHVSDTDGGAHVDPALDEAYMAISRSNSLGWVFTTGNIEKALEGRPELACMRQIAYELLSSLSEGPREFGDYSPLVTRR